MLQLLQIYFQIIFNHMELGAGYKILSIRIQKGIQVWYQLQQTWGLEKRQWFSLQGTGGGGNTRGQEADPPVCWTSQPCYFDCIGVISP